MTDRLSALALRGSLATALLLGAAAPVAADQAVRPFVSAGLTLGGDKMLTANFTNGNSEDINAGELVQLGAGLQFGFPNSGLTMALSLNYHVDSVSAKNGEMEFKRFPLEAILYAPTSNKWRVGAGLRYVNSPELASQIDGGADEALEFDDALGFVGEAGYELARNFWLNLRVVVEEYKPKTFTRNGASFSVTGEAVDGTHVGVGVSYAF